MKNHARLFVATLTLAFACQAGLALAEDFYWTSDSAKPSESAAAAQSSCAACDPACNDCCSCDPCCGTCSDPCAVLGCDACPPVGVVAFAGLDSFRGISDWVSPGNFGAVGGLNAGIPVPGLKKYNIGWQLGMSYGLYDFDGRPFIKSTESQQQVFVTTGFFHKAGPDRRLSFGVVYDWMFNNSWGLMATDPTLGQWRGQIEYAISGNNAFGFWGTLRDRRASETGNAFSSTFDVLHRSVNQANLFWHHKFDRGADSYIYVGLPDKTRITGQGSLADWIIGASVQVPLSDRIALYANGSYLRPSAKAGAMTSMEYGYDVSMGITWFFGRNASSRSINGGCWTPYMPMANNSNFLVDEGFALRAGAPSPNIPNDILK